MNMLDQGAAGQRGGCGRVREDSVSSNGSWVVRLALLLAGAILAGIHAPPAHGQETADGFAKRYNYLEIWKLNTADCDQAFQKCMDSTEPVTQDVNVTLYWCEGSLPSYVPLDGVQCIARQHVETIHRHQFGACQVQFNQCIANKQPGACELQLTSQKWLHGPLLQAKGARRGSGEACVCESRGPEWVVRGTDEACTEAEPGPPGRPDSSG